MRDNYVLVCIAESSCLAWPASYPAARSALRLTRWATLWFFFALH